MRILTYLLIALICISCIDQRKKSFATSSEATNTHVSILENPSQLNSHLPRLFREDHHMYMSWVTTADSLDILYYSAFSDNKWSDPVIIAKGSDWFTNWADFPDIASNNGNILVNYLQKSATGTYTYDVKLNLFSRDQEQWKDNFILHNDGTKSEHGFVSILPFDTSDFFVTWLDGRNTGGGHESHDGHGSAGAMTLRGAFVTKEGTIYDDLELDHRVCDCCQTGAAMTKSGPVVVYRDRSDEEIRDISIVRWDKEEGWSAPQAVFDDHWKIEGCPVNGPSIDAIENTVGIAWFSEAKATPKVQIIFSEDGGKTFEMPIRVDTHETLGRVGLAMLNSEAAAVCWLENVGEDTLIQLRKVQRNGTLGDVITVAQTSSDRSSGFPQLVLLQNNLFIAWTSISEDKTSQLQTARIGTDML